MNHSRSENRLGKQIVNSLDHLLKKLLQMAWLNFLWFLFTLLGLIIGGIFPATTSMITVARKWIQDGMDGSTYQTFKETYKETFKKSNLIGFYLAFITALLALNYYALLELGEQISVFIVFAYYFILIIFSCLLVWLFPLLSHYDAKIIQYFKSAVIIGLTKLPTTLAVMIFVLLIIYFSLMFPSLILFFSVSLIALSIAFFTDRVFVKIDNEAMLTKLTTEVEDRVS